MQRPKEDVWIETDAGRFSAFSSIEVSSDIFGEAQAIFEVGDDRAWRTVHRLLYPSANASILVSGCPVFTGRIDCTELPETVESGTTIQVVMRTRMADARVAGADPSIVLANTSIRDFILRLFAGVGLTSADFLFTPETDRDLVTGRKGAKAPPIDLEPLKADQAKVLPTESIADCAKRHLERHHLMIWEAASGLICVGMPSDTQPPFYRFTRRDGVCNYRSARPVRDWGETPSEMWIYGGAIGKDVTRAPVKGVAVDYDLAIAAASSGHFQRRVVLGVEGAKDQARADLQARRELAARSRRKAAWTVDVDDWSQWDGVRALPYAINATADFDVETHEGTDLNGIFLVTAVRKTYTPDDSTRASLTLLKQGLINPGA